MRVLIVEEEPLIAMSLAAELRRAGHEVLGPSNDADEALCLADQGVDMALVDASMHNAVDGIELARTLHAQCEVPTLLLTTEPETARANADAALGIITLPFDPADIHQTIQAAASALRGHRPEPPSMPNALQLFSDNKLQSMTRTH